MLLIGDNPCLFSLFLSRALHSRKWNVDWVSMKSHARTFKCDSTVNYFAKHALPKVVGHWQYTSRQAALNKIKYTLGVLMVIVAMIVGGRVKVVQPFKYLAHLFFFSPISSVFSRLLSLIFYKYRVLCNRSLGADERKPWIIVLKWNTSTIGVKMKMAHLSSRFCLIHFAYTATVFLLFFKWNFMQLCHHAARI